MNLTNKKIALVSLGCDKNLIDSEVMLGLLRDAGADIIVDESTADIVIINTCGFIKAAVEESTEAIENMFSEKNKDAKVIVAGCMAERYKEEIYEKFPDVAAVIGTGEYENIVSIINDIYISDGARVSKFSEAFGCVPEEMMKNRMVSTPSHYAYIKIAEGCDNHCTYCAIPSIRGKLKSREIEAITEEAKTLAARGIKELIVIAQDTSIYGVDLYGEPKLHSLLRKFSEIEGIEWIRVLYCYPEHIYDELINEIAENEKICKYIDMPIQHSDDNVLKRMGRRGTNAELRSVIGELRKKIPEIAVRTTIITGFPGETEEEFNNLLGFVNEMRFEKLGAFAYSREEGTPADLMQGHLPEKVKRKRMGKIMEAQQAISSEKCRERVGKEVEVIIDNIYEKGVYIGRTQADCPDVDGVVLVRSGKELANGAIVRVMVGDCYEYDLIGDVINEFTE